MIYAYIRVSTDKQTTENQRYEINKYCLTNNIQVDKWVEETISATKDLNKRKLGRIIKQLHNGDILLASELSRLGRRLLEVMSILNHCINTGINVWTIKDNFKLDTGIQSKVLAFAFGLAAEIEKNLISQRTKQALEAKRAAGVILGRPKGRLSTKLKLTGKENDIISLLQTGMSKRKVANKLKVNRNTLAKFLKRLNLNV